MSRKGVGCGTAVVLVAGAAVVGWLTPDGAVTAQAAHDAALPPAPSTSSTQATPTPPGHLLGLKPAGGNQQPRTSNTTTNPGDVVAPPPVLPGEAQSSQANATPAGVAALPVVGVGRVVRVVDGDTVHVVVGGRDLDVRILGIDTPETKDPRKPVQCWGPQASAFAHAQLDGATVTLRSDPTQDVTDRYGRTLAYVIEPNGVNYSIAAARAGAARSYTYEHNPVTLESAIVQAERHAQAADAGLWGPPCNGGR